ncbi:TPA: hypothetical protein ACM9YO_005825, partial [Klebsiella pneumoniae]
MEQVARWPWNAWPDERGLGGRMVWNPHFDEVDADRRAAGVPQADIDRANELVRQKFLSTGTDLIPLVQEANTLSRQSEVLFAQQEYLLTPEELEEARSLIAKPEAYRARSP